MQWMVRGWRWVAAGVMLLSAGVAAAPKADFLGRVAVEWDDNDLFNRHRLVLLADFGFQDAAGKQWIARKGVTLDGTSFTPLFERLVGLPFVGEHRRAGIMHDYFAQQLSHDWQQVRRMYYEALLAEGLGVTEAKTAYAVLYGAGLRWEKKGSTCYINCHNGASALRWRPDVTEAELEPVFDLLNEGNPTLDEIDKAVDAAVPRPGPHLFSQLRPGENGALRPRDTRPKAAKGERDDAPDADAAQGDESAHGSADEPGLDDADAEAQERAEDADPADTPSDSGAATEKGADPVVEQDAEAGGEDADSIDESGNDPTDPATDDAPRASSGSPAQ